MFTESNACGDASAAFKAAAAAATKVLDGSAECQPEHLMISWVLHSSIVRPAQGHHLHMLTPNQRPMPYYRVGDNNAPLLATAVQQGAMEPAHKRPLSAFETANGLQTNIEFSSGDCTDTGGLTVADVYKRMTLPMDKLMSILDDLNEYEALDDLAEVIEDLEMQNTPSVLQKKLVSKNSVSGAIRLVTARPAMSVVLFGRAELHLLKCLFRPDTVQLSMDSFVHLAKRGDNQVQTHLLVMAVPTDTNRVKSTDSLTGALDDLAQWVCDGFFVNHLGRQADPSQQGRHRAESHSPASSQVIRKAFLERNRGGEIQAALLSIKNEYRETFNTELYNPLEKLVDRGTGGREGYSLHYNNTKFAQIVIVCHFEVMRGFYTDDAAQYIARMEAEREQAKMVCGVLPERHTNLFSCGFHIKYDVNTECNGKLHTANRASTIQLMKSIIDRCQATAAGPNLFYIFVVAQHLLLDGDWDLLELLRQPYLEWDSQDEPALANGGMRRMVRGFDDVMFGGELRTRTANLQECNHWRSNSVVYLKYQQIVNLLNLVQFGQCSVDDIAADSSSNVSRMLRELHALDSVGYNAVYPYVNHHLTTLRSTLAGLGAYTPAVYSPRGDVMSSRSPRVAPPPLPMCAMHTQRP
jgi:hypothetical protein